MSKAQEILEAFADEGAVSCTIEIELENAAFEGDPATELVRILKELAKNIENGRVSVSIGSTKIRDVNGNTVGKMTVE